MLKKSWVLFSILACTSSSVTASDYFRSGFFGGAHLGYSDMYGNFDSVWNTVLGGVSRANPASGSDTRSKATFDFFGGYRWVFENGWTWGGELTTAYYGKKQLSATLDNNGLEVVNFLSRTTSLTPALVFGKVLSPRVHAYLSLGLALSRFTQKVHNLNDEVIRESSAWRIGFAPSVGAEYALTPHFSLTGNIGYEIYQKNKKTFGDDLTPGAPGANYVSSLRPETIHVKVGFVFRT